MSGLEEPHREVEPDALTTPRVESSEDTKTGRWRKQRAGTAPGAAYLRWPHPQG